MLICAGMGFVGFVLENLRIKGLFPELRKLVGNCLEFLRNFHFSACALAHIPNVLFASIALVQNENFTKNSLQLCLR